jgi:hypothetical protein
MENEQDGFVRIPHARADLRRLGLGAAEMGDGVKTRLRREELGVYCAGATRMLRRRKR